MTTEGNQLIEATARALLRERIEATPWFRIRMPQKQRQAAIERDVKAYWHLFIGDAADRLTGKAADHNANDQKPHEESDEKEAAPYRRSSHGDSA